MDTPWKEMGLFHTPESHKEITVLYGLTWNLACGVRKHEIEQEAK
jgi:hypothetical protein